MEHILRRLPRTLPDSLLPLRLGNRRDYPDSHHRLLTGLAATIPHPPDSSADHIFVIVKLRNPVRSKRQQSTSTSR